jgi:hypothetical protein
VKLQPIAFVRRVADAFFDSAVSNSRPTNIELSKIDGYLIMDLGNFKAYKSVRIDIGLSHNAPNSAIWSREYPEDYVLGIEPNRFNFARITVFGVWSKSHSKRVRRFKPRNFQALLCAIDDVTKPTYENFYHIRGDSGTSSLLRPTSALLERYRYTIREITPVLAVPLSAILTPLLEHFGEIEMIKIDTQGKDLDVLRSAGALLKHVKRVLVEVDTLGQYVGAPSKAEIFAYLQSAGFEAQYSVDTSPAEDVVFQNRNFSVFFE